jgi:hypothetical protein
MKSPGNRRRPMPKQDDRLTQSLADNQGHEERQKRRHPFLDGDGREVKTELAASTRTDVRHGLGRVPRGVQLLWVGGETTAIAANVPHELVVENDGKPTTPERTKETVSLYNNTASVLWVHLWIY